MTDAEHVAAVREAVRQLNTAIDAAARDGLAVEIDTISKYCFGDTVESVLVTGKVCRTTTRETV